MPTDPPRRKPASKPYQKVFPSRKRRVRGLWHRGGRFYANLTIADDMGRKAARWVPLSANTLVEAQTDLRKLPVEREDDRLRPLGQQREDTCPPCGARNPASDTPPRTRPPPRILDIIPDKAQAPLTESS